MSSHYLHALDIEDSRSGDSLSDMERQDYIDMITSLRESNDRLLSMVSDLRDTVQSLNRTIARHEESDAIKDKRISDLTEKINELVSSLAYANEKLSVRG